jgi:hypothetical protein
MKTARGEELCAIIVAFAAIGNSASDRVDPPT